MPLDIAIRPAVPADLQGLQHVYRSASLSNAGDAPLLLANPQYLEFPGDGIATGRTLVAVAGDQVVGFATCTDGPDDGPDLEDLFVDPTWMRQGIARRLVNELAATARATGHERLWVTGNPHALAFYLATGFRETAHVATELGSGSRMYLDLTGTDQLK